MLDHNSSESGSEDVAVNGLIATRAKRSTAGNLYATLRANLDDEEIQRELLAEDEEDVGDYEGSDRDDDDEAMESSSDEGDAGPPKEGDQEDLEGEKELKRAERAEARKKRKMDEAKMRLPAWQKKKKVKLADNVKLEDGASGRPKKKSERSNWLPAGADMPVRQSSRASAIANREVVHTNLKEFAIRSEKQKRVMANHAEKLYAKKRAELTQEERLAKAAKIEKETAREFGRWEREEAERQRIREEQLAAKRKRDIAGPIIKQWSSSVLWEGEKLKVKRMYASRNVETVEDHAEKKEVPLTGHGTVACDVVQEATDAADTPAQNDGNGMSSGNSIEPPLPASEPQQQQGLQQPQVAEVPADNHPALSILPGIKEYADQPSSLDSTEGGLAYGRTEQPPYTPSAPALNVAPSPTSLNSSLAPFQAPSSTVTDLPHANLQPPMSSGMPSASCYQFPLSDRPQIPLPPAPPPPLIKEQAQRTLIILEQFRNLETANTTGRRGAAKPSKDAGLEPSPIASTLMPLSYPSFTPDYARYLTAKVKKSGFPLAPPRKRCALTTWPARYVDPKTGLPYADMQQYKMIQRLLAGGCSYSSLLGAYVGPTYGSMGRAANGVPEGFGAPVPTFVADEVKSEASA